MFLVALMSPRLKPDWAAQANEHNVVVLEHEGQSGKKSAAEKFFAPVSLKSTVADAGFAAEVTVAPPVPPAAPAS